eukprot:NODE_12203_length_179_cov_6.369231_g12120_i0.p2 GENE.NODE_12203_length_179_cov_6.369231_g12120_i0~~NODE_12203_length_179_cov_6.369231_g12120_i0.p2  ORF type:complete len:56 (-),score=12.95 NODE_12203_length_179_cov_6.369231_g12120_i0:12-155(-)
MGCVCVLYLFPPIYLVCARARARVCARVLSISAYPCVSYFRCTVFSS